MTYSNIKMFCTLCLLAMLTVACEQKNVNLRIKSNVPEATVYINGKEIGTTPIDTMVVSGQVKVEVSAYGYGNFRETYTLAAETSKIVEAKLYIKIGNQTWNDLGDTWKKVFNKAIDKGEVTTAPNKEELERIVNLQKLNCSGNKITDLSPLKNLTKLKELVCESNQITELSPLKNLTKLQRLYCPYNQITELSPLKNLTKLEELSCSWNKITDLSPIKNLTKLQRLLCYENQITDLSPIKNLTKLKELYCSYNQITDLSPIKNLTKLKGLWCGGNQITDLSPIKNLTKLEWLQCSDNQISNAQIQAFKEQRPNCIVYY